jgi:biotin synthase
MNNILANILEQKEFSRNDLITLVQLEGEEQQLLFKKAREISKQTIGDKVFFRGLIEFSNICTKDCLYCGIRKTNHEAERYDIDDEAILNAARFAWENRYGSVVLQSGERSDSKFVERIGKLLTQIKELSHGELGITLSLGEQTEETYQYWRECGAHRFLLRIETSNEELYYKVHPKNDNHNYQKRRECLALLKKTGYQVGTGVMIGLPFQTWEDLADDLLLMKSLDIDMVGMGPYIEHHDTPLYEFRDQLWPLKRRFDVAMNMIATLRLLMPDINIAAATALQAIDPMGREKALQNGANIIMPNITPTTHRKDYLLYDNKPCTDEGADDCTNCINIRIEMAGRKVAYGEWGDSQHFANRQTP